MKIAFWSVFATGFLACSVFGIGPVLQRMGGNWLSAPMLLGSVLGVAILGVGALFWTGVRPVPLSTDTAMVVALAVLVGVKVLVGAVALAGPR